MSKWTVPDQPKKDPTQKKRTHKYHRSMADKGHVQVKPWVPKHKRAEIMAIARAMREEHEGQIE